MIERGYITKKYWKLFAFILGLIVSFAYGYYHSYSRSPAFRYSEIGINVPNQIQEMAHRHGIQFGFIAIFIYITVCFLIWAFINMSKSSKALQEQNKLEEERQEEMLLKSNIKKDVEHNFRGAIINVRYIVDISTKRICLISYRADKINAIHELRQSKPDLSLGEAKETIDKGRFELIDFDEINGVEIMEDSSVIGGIGRAIVGGVLAGGIGAIVGATTAKNHMANFELVIYTKNIANPQIVLPLIKTKTKKDSLDYKSAYEFANKINASIKAIISNQTSDATA